MILLEWIQIVLTSSTTSRSKRNRRRLLPQSQLSLIREIFSITHLLRRDGREKLIDKHLDVWLSPKRWTRLWIMVSITSATQPNTELRWCSFLLCLPLSIVSMMSILPLQRPIRQLRRPLSKREYRSWSRRSIQPRYLLSMFPPLISGQKQELVRLLTAVLRIKWADNSSNS